MALENNLDLVSARKDPLIAEERIGISRAEFDGVVTVNTGYNDTDSDQIISDNLGIDPPTDGGRKSDALNADIEFSHQLAFGGTYSVKLDASDSQDQSTFVPSFTGIVTTTDTESSGDGLILGYDMPLLNGFGKEVNRLDVLLAHTNLEISREDLRLQAMQTAQAVEDAYWDLVAAGAELEISRKALKRTEALLDLNRKKVKVGTLAPIEITEAEASVANQVEAVILAETNLENAEDVLLQLMAIPADSAMWEQTLSATDQPSFAPTDVDVQAAIDTAYENRPEMTTARQRLENDELSERVARRGLNHRLDLSASVTPQRRTDTDQAVTVGTTPTGNDNFDTEQTDWQVGLRYTYTIGNRSARSNYAIATLNKQKTDIALRNTEQEIRVDVRRSVRNLESGLQRVEAARKNVELQEKKLKAEEKKFDNGMSTSFEVLTFQTDLANAELSEIRARLDYAKALTSLERSKGTLLEARNMTLGE